MKQHISIQDLNELSDKGKERLRDWWKPQEGDWFVRWFPTEQGYLQPQTIYNSWNDIDENNVSGEKDLPLLSIGQMIEYLTSVYGKRVDMDQFKDFSDPKTQWCVEAKHMAYVDEELCDALWEATKECLEK